MFLNSFLLIPSLGNLATSYVNKNRWVFVDAFVALFEIFLPLFWMWLALTNDGKIGLSIDNERWGYSWTIPVVAYLISFGFWENFIDTNPFYPSESNIVSRVKADLEKGRHALSVFLGIWKIILIMIIFILSIWLSGYNFKEVSDSWGFFKFSCYDLPLEQMPIGLFSFQMTPQILTIVHILSNYICFVASKMACKIFAQKLAFSIPNIVSWALTVVLVTTICWLCPFEFSEKIYLFSHWDCKHPKYYSWRDLQLSLSFAFWIVSIMMNVRITWHIWEPKNEALALTEKVFVNPMSRGPLSCLFLLLNRKKYFDNPRIMRMPLEYQEHTRTVTERTDYRPKIYACGTMWHETKGEMMNLIKSLIEMDGFEAMMARNNQRYFECNFDFEGDININFEKI